MRSLYLLRHAKSDWNSPHGSDHDRPLASRGRRSARLVGEILSRLGQEPHSVVTSTAVRAHETARLAAAAGSWTCSIRATERLYLPSVAAVLAEARAEPAEIVRLLMVGHEPTWSESVGSFIGDRKGAGPVRVKMVTAALARLDFSGDDWSRIDFGQATLAWLATPKLLERAAADGSDSCEEERP